MASLIADLTSIEDVVRKLGISQATFYRWKSKYGGLLPAEMKKLKQHFPKHPHDLLEHYLELSI